MSPSEARYPRVMLNPSCQYLNQIFDSEGREIYNEGHTMWRFAQSVKNHLEAAGGVEVFVSRESEAGESDLETEAALTRELGCDLLLALHSDATADGTEGGGTWTFYTGATHLAEEELASLPYPLQECCRFAELVQKQTLDAISPFHKTMDRGIREHWYRLKMLHDAQCVASLVEILFHTNPVERELLKSPDFQDSVGRALAQAILQYFQ